LNTFINCGALKCREIDLQLSFEMDD